MYKPIYKKTRYGILGDILYALIIDPGFTSHDLIYLNKLNHQICHKPHKFPHVSWDSYPNRPSFQ